MVESADVNVGPLPRTQALIADDIVQHLERLIVTGELAAGTSLRPERALATELGVSRNALREALTRLEGLGLLERRQGSANRVSRTIPLTVTLASRLQEVAADFGHSAEFRTVIEPRIARIAAERIDADHLAALSGILDDSASETNADRSVSLDIAFHTAVARATVNPLLATLGELIASWTVEARVFSHLQGEGRRLSHRGHARIHAALAAHDPDAADYAMRIHLAEIRDMIERVRTADPLSEADETPLSRSDQFG